MTLSADPSMASPNPPASSVGPVWTVVPGMPASMTALARTGITTRAAPPSPAETYADRMAPKGTARRKAQTAEVVRHYTAGLAMRAVATATGLSYGKVHRLLVESGVQRRRSGRVRGRGAGEAGTRA